jgi:hypothetical protein
MSMSEQTPRQHQRKGMFRTVAAVSTAAILLGSSFYAAQAGLGAGQYEDDLDGSGEGTLIGVSVGVAVGTFLLAGAIGRDDDNADKPSEEKAKSSKNGKVEAVRVVPTRDQLGAGESAVVQVQARYQGSKTWQDVTESASIRLVSGGLTQVDGTKNAFAVPYGSSVSAGSSTVEASFGGKSDTAKFQVN